MSLGKRIEILLHVLLVAFACSAMAIQYFVVYDSFVELERKEAVRDMRRCVKAVESEITHLTKLVSDWAIWDDAHDYLITPSEEFIKSSLTDDVYEGTGFNLVFFIHLDGGVVYGRIRDNVTGKNLTLKEFPTDRWPADHALLSFKSEKANNAGIILSEHGPMIISAMQVVHSNGIGPPAGFFVMGRFLDTATTRALVERTQVDFQAWPVTAGGVPEPERTALNRMPSGQILISSKSPPGFTFTYYTLADIHGERALLLRASSPRDISRKGWTAMGLSIALALAFCLIVLQTLRYFIRSSVVRPVTRLTACVTHITQSGHLDARVHMNRRDEIGVLAAAFDQMLERIEEDTAERTRLSLELERLSMVDGLTGLSNRRHLDDIIRLEWSRALREGSTVAMLMVDVDFFKRYNDRKGHLAGDEALRCVARTLRGAVRRAADLSARFGGEEFACLLPATDAAGALHVAELARAAVEATAIPHPDSEVSPNVTISIGVAAIIPRRDSSCEVLIAAADRALYEAKRLGRNRVALDSSEGFEPTGPETA